MKLTALRTFAFATLIAGAPALLQAQTTYGERHDIHGRGTFSPPRNPGGEPLFFSSIFCIVSA